MISYKPMVYNQDFAASANKRDLPNKQIATFFQSLETKKKL